MASLLALLSHPSEILGTDEGVTSQSVVFVIDEFDMFATHPRQTLLYNLFDIAQSRKAPIAVLGCTTRLDVVEMLEKRVKSRFSHRYIYLSLPKTLPAYWQVCRQGLLLEKADLVKEGIDATLEGYEDFHKYWRHKIEVNPHTHSCSSIEADMKHRRSCIRSDHSKIFFNITTTRPNRRQRSWRNGCYHYQCCHGAI